MTLPGFTAEASLYQTSDFYQETRAVADRSSALYLAQDDVVQDYVPTFTLGGGIIPPPGWSGKWDCYVIGTWCHTYCSNGRCFRVCSPKINCNFM
jgi:hypothetical protein